MSKASHIKLVHKILALVLVPFLLNGLWLFLLNDALSRKAQMVEIERAQARYLDNLNHCIQLFYDATGKLFEYELTSDPAAQRHGLDAMRQLKELISRMQLGAQVTAKSKEDLESIGALIEQELSELSQPITASSKPELSVFLVRVNQARRVFKKAVKRSTTILLSIQEHQQDLDELRRQEQKSARNLEFLVLAGFAGNLVLAISFACFVTVDFSRRFTVLLNNSQRLGKRLPMTETMAGNDELRALDVAMRSAAADLQQAFEFRASMMEMVAHDLRSPLQASQLSLERLTEIAQDKLDEQAYLHVERVQTNNGRLLALIEDLLTIDHLESGSLTIERSIIKVKKAVAESVLAIGGLAATSNVRIINLCGDEVIQADARRLAQVFNNILSNAIKYSPPGSEIEITTKSEGGNVVISVVDSGIGLTEAERQRVFDKFYQADGPQKSKGFGLGLAISKMIVSAHGGSIGVESNRESGSRFWFSLPLADC
jgi:signal transduction histidine kinase